MDQVTPQLIGQVQQASLEATATVECIVDFTDLQLNGRGRSKG